MKHTNLKQQIKTTIVRYNARRHDIPNDVPRKDPRPPIDKAVEELVTLFETIALELIGEDEAEPLKADDPHTLLIKSVNKLRAAQRAKLSKIIGGKDE